MNNIKPRFNEAKAKYVYLIGRNDGSVKIGVSNNVRRRRAALAISSPDDLRILRIVKAGKNLAFHIETAFKRLMEPCRKRGEWFKCDDVLAVLALHVVEHGDLKGRTIITAALSGNNAQARCAYEEEIYRQYPEAFEYVNSLDRILIRSRVEPPKRPYRVNIYPDEWNNARLEANRQRAAALNVCKNGFVKSFTDQVDMTICPESF